MAEYRFHGRMVEGLGVGGKYVSHPYYEEQLGKLLGCKPFPGTLNLETDTDWRELSSNCAPIVVKETVWEGRVLGAVYAWRARLVTVKGEARVLVIRPLKSVHSPRVLELVACERLRGLVEGVDRVEVVVDCKPNPWHR